MNVDNSEESKLNVLSFCTGRGLDPARLEHRGLAALEIQTQNRQAMASPLQKTPMAPGSNQQGAKMTNKENCKKYYEKNKARLCEQKRNAAAGTNSWKSLKQRCNNENREDYQRYGGRGISYPKNWETFAGFIADMGTPPSRAHTIERINNNISYSVDNCRWATRSEQMQNTSMTKLITHQGVTQSISEWCRCLGLKRSTVASRMARRGITAKDAMEL